MSNKYYLVLEYLPGDFMTVDINVINQDNNNYYLIQNIDQFTTQYSEEEIKNLISKANIVPDRYLNGKLHIINENKYRFPILTKDCNFSLDKFILENIDDKQVMNKFINVFRKYDKNNFENINNAIKKRDITKIINILFSLPYESIRGIYIYLYLNV